ncbi:MAG TPA: twin-arginine translocation pathway signal [Pseudolabrys sp.]|nr:twin-arginine translocation pathway signal [Pseudolabrys sp.]
MNWTFRVEITAIAALMLSGCASETASRFLVEPDRYVLYSCKELATQAQNNAGRQHELELLIAKAGSGVASAMAYQPEYLQLRGEMTQLRKTAVDKNCNPLPSAPGQAPAAGERTSDQMVR